MSLGFSIGGVKIGLTSEGDISKYLKPGTDAILHLRDTAEKLLSIPSSTLAAVPQGSLALPLTTDTPITWDLGAANLALTFQPHFEAGVRVTNHGPLLAFANSDVEGGITDVMTPPGQAYVSISFEVTLEAGIGGAYSAGQFGVQANIEGSQTFCVSNHRLFPSDTKLTDAVRDALVQFRMPFLPGSILALQNGDLLDFEFIGKLALGFGVTYGIQQPLLGGRSPAEISQSFGSDLFRTGLKLKPFVEAGASVAVAYDHEDAFRFVFAREAERASLTILRKKIDETSVKETVGVIFAPGATVDLTANLNSALDQSADGMFGTAAGDFRQALRSRGGPAIGNLVARVNQAVNGLLAKDARGGVKLQALQSATATNTALFRVWFDFTDPAAIQKPIELAAACDIRGAIACPGVSLAPGSWVEQEFRKRSSFGLQLFDLWKWSNTTDYIRNTDIVYAGAGMLRLIAHAGVKHSQGIVGHQSQCDVHFLARVGHEVDGGLSGPVDVRLVFELFDANRSNAQATVRLLEALGVQQATLDAASAPPPGGMTSTCEFPQALFDQFRADPYLSGRPGPLPHPADQANYAAFVAAARAIEGRWLGFDTYDDWAEFNRVANHGEGSSAVPDRRNSGNVAVWPQRFMTVHDEGRRSLCRFWSESARRFMNLCEALHDLTTAIDATTTDAAFDDLLDQMNAIIANDVPEDFIKATLLALVKTAHARNEREAVTQDGPALRIALSVAAVGAAGG